MPGKSNSLETGLLALIFNATAYANVAQNAAAPLTNLYVSLHTSDPGEAGDQTTNEISYTSYARVAVIRTSGGWTVSGNTAVPVANIDFPASTGGAGGTVTHFAVGANTTGEAGRIFYFGTVTPNIVVSNGVTPRLTTATTISEE